MFALASVHSHQNLTRVSIDLVRGLLRIDIFCNKIIYSSFVRAASRADERTGDETASFPHIQQTELMDTLQSAQSAQTSRNNTTKPKRPQKISWALIISMIIGGLAGYGGMKLFFTLAPNAIKKHTVNGTIPVWLDLSVIAILTLIGIVGAIAFHEWGHVLGGKMAGFRFYLFIVGPLRIAKPASRLEFSLNKDLSLYGGIAACIPQGNTTNIRGGMMRMILGGPIASVILGIVLLGTAFLLRASLPTLEYWGSWLVYLYALTGAISLLLALITGIPMSGNGFFSDGARVRMLLRNDAVAERYAASSALAGMALSNKPMREIPEELVKKSLSVADGTIDDISAHITAYYRYLDCASYDQAAEHLDYAITYKDKYPSAFQPMLTIEAAFFHAFYHNNPEQAEQWLQATPDSPFVKSYTRKRAEAAIAVANNDTQKANNILESAHHNLSKEEAQNSGVLLEKTLWEVLRSRIA